MKNRNISFDYIKFVSIIIIIIHHSLILDKILFHGYIVVELFFMISGYLLISKCQKIENLKVKDLLKNRLKRLYPEYFFAWMLLFIVSWVGYRQFPYAKLYNMFTELFLIQISGGINYPTWYISVMVWAEIVILFTFKFTGSKKTIVISLIITLFVYGYLFVSSPSTIEVWGIKAYVLYIPFWRGLADMLLGCIIYFVSKHLQGKVNSKWVNLTYVGLLGILGALIFSPGNVDYICILIISMIILLSTFENNFVNKSKSGKLHSFITKYQYGLYLNHWCIFLLFGKIKKFMPNQIFSLVVLLVCTIIGTVIYKQFQDIVMKILAKQRHIKING